MHHSTNHEILRLADRLIRRQGYNGFSYANLAQSMHVKNAAIHYHFPTKTNLGTTVINKELRSVINNRLEWTHLPGNEQLKNVVNTFLQRSLNEQACLTGALASEYLTFADELQDKVQEMCRDYLDWMTSIMEKGRLDKTLQFEGSPADRALLVLSVLMSSLLLARIMGRETFDTIIDQLMKDLRAGFGAVDLDEGTSPF